jgi:iron complex outermembrane recepter protein
VTPKLTLVAGVFSVKKPYFNLDSSLRYRQLGRVDNRGVEVSLAGQIVPGVTLVAGSLFLDPTISGEDVNRGRIGPRPVGSLTRRSVANLDWRLDAGQSPLSFDMALESLSGRTGNALNSVKTSAREIVNLGLRYRFALAKTSWLLRPQMTNVFNEYGWNVSSSGGFTASNSRTYTVMLTADF